MQRFATPLGLAVLLAFGPAASAQTVDSRTHDTGLAALRVFNNGYIGADVGAPTDTTFNFGGFAPLYEGQVLVALGETQVSGQPYSTTNDNGQEWRAGTGPDEITAPLPFTTAYEATYTDNGTSNPDPAGLTVTQRSYSRPGDAFVVVEVEVSSATARQDVYIGMFADYDVSATAVTDVGNFDEATQTAYTENNAATGNQNFYGLTLLGEQASGYSLTTDTQDDFGLYLALTQDGGPGTPQEDRRTTVGAGPFDISAGGSATARFAFVGGATLADLLASAAVARGLFVAGESGPGQTAVALSPARPNPTAGTAELSLEVERGQTVRVAAYDALGREVAVLFDGPVAAGVAQPLRLDGARLPAGLYVVRAAGETFQATQRVAVSR